MEGAIFDVCHLSDTEKSKRTLRDAYYSRRAFQYMQSKRYHGQLNVVQLTQSLHNNSQHFWELLVREMLDGVGRCNNSKQWKDVRAVYCGKDATH